jgi:MYXO-CTERM domain-containing protein
MLYGPIGKRALAGLVVVVGTLVGASAHADVGPCTGVGTGGPTCPPPVSCIDDAECFGAGGGRCAGGHCSANCGSLFECNSTSDCPRFDPLVPTCQRATVTGANGFCIYADAAANPVTTLCAGAAGTAVSYASVRACFSAGPDWSMGDCDGDHVPNGIDGDPCSAVMLSMRLPTPNPFCLPGHVCEGTTSVCAPFLRCGSDDPCIATAGHIGATGPWQCLPVPGVSSIHVCQPSCNATAQCTGAADCGGFGTCTASGTAVSFCESSRIMSCAPSCMSRTLDWVSANGDCDGDGAQNGCDANPCAPGDPHCVANAAICSPDPLPDAGTDAAIFPFSDAGRDAGNVSTPDVGRTLDASNPGDASLQLPDASTPADDAASQSMDGGGSGIDARAIETTPGLGFGGGGGCRCAAPGQARSSTGAALVMLVLAASFARRRH